MGLDPSPVSLEVITAADGSEAPGGATISEERPIPYVVTFTPGILPVRLLGGAPPGLFVEKLSGDDGCLEQWNGTSFAPFTTISRDALPHYRASPNAPAGGCGAGLGAGCTPGGGIGCPPPGTPATPTIVGVRHGTVDVFFIQTPDRICDDGEPAEFSLGRLASGNPTIGPLQESTSVDLFVCVHTSFGAWLRYDEFSDNNPDIVWTGPAARAAPAVGGALISPINQAGTTQQVPIDGTPEGGGHGFVRTNWILEDAELSLPQDRRVRATGRNRFDEIDIRRAGVWPPVGSPPYAGVLTAVAVQSANNNRAGSNCALVFGRDRKSVV